METVRLKNIVIIILALLNLFLLSLIVSNQVRTSRAAQETRDQIFLLFEKNNIALDPATAKKDTRADTLLFLRDTAAEQAFAESLLGKCTWADEGGGIYSYTSPTGIASFHTTGTFDISTTGIPVDSPQEFAAEICRKFGYEAPTADLTEDGTGTLSASAHLDGHPVLNASILFTFTRGKLISVSGIYLSSCEVVPGGEVSLSATDALADFVDHTVNNGLICHELLEMKTAYVLHSTTDGIRLTPVWLLQADTFRCYTAGDENGILQLSA